MALHTHLSSFVKPPHLSFRVQSIVGCGRRGRYPDRGVPALPRVPRRTKATVAQVAAPAPDLAHSTSKLHQEDEKGFKLVCPICLTTEIAVHQQRQSLGLNCQRCARTFQQNPKYVDLTLQSGVVKSAYNDKQWGGVEIFRSPMVSFAYERGWRQGFRWAGFPGPDKEFDMAMKYLQPAHGEVLLDMSCGSGLFSRRFVKSGQFEGVIAADFSETMLEQTWQFFNEDRTLDTESFMLLRADVGRLPFATGSLAAVHAGAAIHCWPNPTAALAEISRVLRPGGVFVASTFMNYTAPLGAIVGDELVRPLKQLEKPLLSGSYRWWEEAELRELNAFVGLQNFQCQRNARFIMFSVTKPVGQG